MIKDGRRKKLAAGINRRDFLKYSGAAGGALLLEVVSKPQIRFKGKAQTDRESAAYMGM